jgi:hypothetical protein
MSENKKLDLHSNPLDQFSKPTQTLEVGGAIVHDIRNDGGEASGDRSTAERAAQYLKEIGVRPSLVAERLRDYHDYNITPISGQVLVEESDLVEESISSQEGYFAWTLIDNDQYVEERSLPLLQTSSLFVIKGGQELTQTAPAGRKIDFLGLIPEGSKIFVPENIIPFPFRRLIDGKKAA